MNTSKKIYNFSITSTAIAAIIAKVRLMQKLSAEEELVYLIQVKNLSEEAALKIINSKTN